ncbi:MAG TPA: efflux RND transporter periplasmic adaptor subunit [Thermoanaerobaculia bacterium]|nr:efflux RND transporter periplasmic adaptor subunit [Thermoanaerobaculia bacterium]
MNKLAVVALLITAALSFSACSPDTVNAQEAAAAKASPAIVAAPVIRNVAITQSYPAQVEAIERVELRPQVSGSLDAVNFTEGAIVSRGQVLFRIDQRPYAAALAEAEAALTQAKADAEATVREGERAARLVEKKAISQEDADRRVASASVASARVAAARAAVERARLNLSFTEVRSPISGRIGRAEITRGNLVSPETRLGVVVSIDPVYVRFDVDENTLTSQLGKTRGQWRVNFNGMPAQVAFVENEIGRGTGTLRIRAKLQNPNGKVIPGMYGTATLTLGEEKNAVLVRDEAIGADQGQRFVLVVDEKNTLQYRAVTLGAREGDLRVIKSGLTATDKIVINGLFRLRPGTPVAPNVVAMEKEG